MTYGLYCCYPINPIPQSAPTRESLECETLSSGESKLLLVYKVYIFDRERCDIDAFRYLSKEIAIKAIQRYFQNIDHKQTLRNWGAIRTR